MTHSSGFAAFRTPLLPFEEFDGWTHGMTAPSAVADPAALEHALAADRELLRRRLRAVMARPEVREALFLASPSLEESLAIWEREPESGRGLRVERALVRYFTRMTWRSTPFGLFAGCSSCLVGGRTRLAVAARSNYHRHTRLDMEYLCALAEGFERRATLRRTVRYYPNSSLYEAAGRVRYVEPHVESGTRSYRLVAVERTEYLQAVLSRAECGAGLESLARAIAGGDVSVEEAEEYVTELIDSRILMSELEPAVTGNEPIHRLVAALREDPASREDGDRLDRVQAMLDGLDSGGLGASPDRYREIAARLEGLPARLGLPRLFQVDMLKPVERASLGSRVLAEIERGIDILRRLAKPDRTDGLARFTRAFVERFGDREVPLAEALDEEVGIGFEPSTAPGAEASPLLDGLVFPRRLGSTTDPPPSLLLRKLSDALMENRHQIELDDRDLATLASEEPPRLPDAFHVMATVAAPSGEAADRGDFRVLVEGLAGPPGTRLIGRFCHAEAALRAAVEEHCRAEQRLEPDVILAEIVHLPEGRLGNILSRPVLRDFEIPYLGRSGAPRENQIPISDLLVSVRQKRVVLRSRRHGREVIPRLTSAHNYSWRSLGLYRFLCELQTQGWTGRTMWSWGALRDAPFLPRVVAGKVVLSRARWRVGGDELRALGRSRGASRFAAVKEWQSARRLPRLVVLADADNHLLVDLDNVLSVESFVRLVQRRDEARLLEMFPGPGELCARGPEGRFVHELVVPFVRARQQALRQETLRPPAVGRTSLVSSIRRRFVPGSEWLYAKLYTGTSTADGVLREIVAPLASQAIESGAAGCAADRWHFVRYADPDWHIRLRFHGAPERLHREVLPALQQASERLLDDDRVWRLQLDTYVREVERYGGDAGIVLAERLFHADSDAALAIIQALPGDDGAARARWRIVLRGMDALLSDLGFDLPRRLAVVRGARDDFAREFAIGAPLRRQIGAKFATLRTELEALLEADGDAEGPLGPALPAFGRRSREWAGTIDELKRLERAGRLTASIDRIAPSLLHMHANRLLRSDHRAQEAVLLDLLYRIYDARAARRSSVVAR